jgi:hypothetical protein
MKEIPTHSPSGEGFSTKEVKRDMGRRGKYPPRPITAPEPVRVFTQLI